LPQLLLEINQLNCEIPDLKENEHLSRSNRATGTKLIYPGRFLHGE